MSQVDTEESRLVGSLSEDNANQSDVTGDGSRLVPVTESITILTYINSLGRR